jgi:DNA-binding transcriptional regulator YiaG
MRFGSIFAGTERQDTWESGAKRPSDMALKLLDIVEKHGLKVLA